MNYDSHFSDKSQFFSGFHLRKFPKVGRMIFKKFSAIFYTIFEIFTHFNEILSRCGIHCVFPKLCTIFFPKIRDFPKI